ncbi:MAG: hypothetical protein AVO38_01420 [delta proteobacterium ML8_D]|nr:MAG: hypothetical protein AVO38_01420 [delta proteobacterium ML8_D]
MIIAQEFNLSIINSVWLFKNKIFTEEELQGKASLPILVEAQSKDFNFKIIPERLQFSISLKCDNASRIISSKVGEIIKLLPHTPYTAAGFNFTYNIFSKVTGIGELTRSLFCRHDSKLFSDFDTEDARFGGYFSKDIIGTRLSLEAKPVTTQKQDIKEEKLKLAYNFQITLSPQDDSNMILDFLKKWDEAKKITQEITYKLDEGY